MSDALGARLRGRAVLGALFSLGIKVGGSVAGLVMFALAAWTLDVAAFGRLVIVFNIVSLAAVAAVLGQDTLIQRSWGEYVATDAASARGAVIFGAAVAASGATIAALAFLVWAGVDGRLSGVEIVAVTAFLITQTLLHFTTNLARIVRGAWWSEPPRELFWRLPLVAGLGAAVATGDRASITFFFAVAAVAQAVGLLYLGLAVRAGLPAGVRAARPRFRLREWGRRSGVMTSAALAEAAHQYADVVLIGQLLGASAAAGYFVVLRIANIFAMLTSGIHTYSASKVSHLYYLGRTEELQRLMAQIMALTLVLVMLLFATIVGGGGPLLSIFGAEYRGLHGELVLMSLLTAVTALAGPGPMLMLSMGADLVYLKLVVAALVVRVVGLLALAPALGLDGAILAVAIAVVPLVATVTVLCRRRLGIDPSVLAVPRGLSLRPRRDPTAGPDPTGGRVVTTTTIAPSAPPSPAPVRETAAHGGARASAVLLFLIVVLSTGSFSPDLVDPSRNEFLQQAAVEVLWIGLVLLALPRARFDGRLWDPRVGAVAALVFWAALSSLWSGAGPSAFLKGGAMAFNVAAVFLLSLTLRFDDVVDVVVAGLATMIFASIALVVFAPEIGLVKTWQHAGQWSGVFEQKQTLGIAAAMLLYLALMRLSAHCDAVWRVGHLVVAAAAIACIVGSGSRGGGGLALAATAIGVMANRSRLVRGFAGAVPILALLTAVSFMTMLVVSDRDVLTFGDEDIDLTDRTRIWKHALDWLSGGNLLVGWGLNGFWSRKDVADAFLGGHDWFLDNYHSGYLAVLGDCGLVGGVLLAATTLAVVAAGVGSSAAPEFRDKVLSLGFVALFYVINVTETYMLRSTNMASLIFFFFVFRLLSTDRVTPAPAPAAVHGPAPGAATTTP